MSLGAELVTAVLDTGELQPLLDAGFTREWLNTPDSGSYAVFGGEDYEAYKYVLDHWDRHGRVITRRLFGRNFPTYNHGEDTEATVAELLEPAQREVRRAVLEQLLGDASDLVEQDRIDAALDRLRRLDQPGVTTPGKTEYRIWQRADLDDLPEPETLIDSYLHLGALVSLFGRFSTAKSFLALDWACHVATRRPWQGYSIGSRKLLADDGTVLSEENHRVLFVAAEGGHGQRKRIRAWEKAYNKGRKIKNVDFMIVPIQISDAAAQQFLVKAIRDEAYGLVIIDTQARATVGMDENSAQDMGVVVEAVYKLRDAFEFSGTTVVLVHHAGKAGTDRGSSAVSGAVDVQYKLVDQNKDDFDNLIPGPFLMSCSKPPKDTEMPPSQMIYLRDEHNSLVIEDNSAAKAAALGTPAPKPKDTPAHKRKTRIYVEDVADREGISESAAYKRLAKRVKDGELRHVTKSEADDHRAYWEKIPPSVAAARHF